MLADRCGCEDGFAVRYFRKSTEYWLADNLACLFLRNKDAVLVTPIIIQTENPMSLASRRQLIRVEEPATEPLTLAEVKLYLRIDGSEEDALVTDLIVVARAFAERYLKQSLVTQSWKIAMDTAFPLTLKLAMLPVQSIESVSSYDTAGVQTVISDELYGLNAAMDAVVFEQEVSGHRVEVIYDAGYGDAEDIPRPICLGMMAHIAYMYENRGAHDAPPVSLTLYQPYREVGL